MPFVLFVLLVANRITKGLPGEKGVKGILGPPGHDGPFGMKGGKLISHYSTCFTVVCSEFLPVNLQVHPYKPWRFIKPFNILSQVQISVPTKRLDWKEYKNKLI